MADESTKKQRGCTEAIMPYALTSDKDSLTEEERERQHQVHVLGGKARAEQLRKAKTLRETTKDILETLVSKNLASAYIKDEEIISALSANPTLQEILTARMAKEVLDNGNTKAIEYLRDTSGQKPINENLLVTADVTTDSDRALMANIAERLGIKPTK